MQTCRYVLKMFNQVMLEWLLWPYIFIVRRRFSYISVYIYIVSTVFWFFEGATAETVLKILRNLISLDPDPQKNFSFSH